MNKLGNIPLHQPTIAYHYLFDTKYLKSIPADGLLAPSQLAKLELIDQSLDNYRERLEQEGLEPTQSNLLKFLDNLHSDIDGNVPDLGRNLIFALLQPIKEGISDEHDELARQTPVKINLDKLGRVPGVKFYMVELPSNPETKQVSLGEIRQLASKDQFRFYDYKNADGMLFGFVPHLAIYVPTGQIPPDYLSI